MLRITLLTTGASPPVSATRLMLEGRLDGPWVDELAETWAAVRDGKTAVEVNLDGLTYASESGAAMLRSMRTQGAAFTSDSPLVDAWVEDQIAPETQRFWT